MSKFFVIEGLDGSGKTSQVKRLNEWFSEKKIPCFTTRQPSDDRIGALAREATYGAFPAENETLALLFAAEHYQHFCGKIAPALSRGEYVICDRYYYSNFVYQGVDESALQRIFSYNKAVMNAKKPDAVFFIDVSPEECMRRITVSREEISVFEALDKLKTQQKRYLNIFEKLRETENIFIIEAQDCDENMVFEKLLDFLHKFKIFGEG